MHAAVGSAIRFSGVPVVANFINLLTGAKGTPSGGPTAVCHANIGPSNKFVAASTQKITFAGQSTNNDTNVTLAAIFVPTQIFCE
jgi:hypothetical protein